MQKSDRKRAEEGQRVDSAAGAQQAGSAPQANPLHDGRCGRGVLLVMCRGHGVLLAVYCMCCMPGGVKLRHTGCCPECGRYICGTGVRGAAPSVVQSVDGVAVRSWCVYGSVCVCGVAKGYPDRRAR